MYFFRFCGLVLVSAALVFAQNNAQTPSNGNNLIQPLAELQKNLKGKLEHITVHGKALEGNLNGSFYSSSKTTGDWETFIAVELVNYIDSHYRTIPGRMSRGLAGHSMGGYGTFRIGMKHPEVFSSLFSMSACCMVDAPVIAAKWMANSLIVMLQEYAPNLKKMKAIEMNVGLQDGLLQTNRDMDEALSDAGVAHHFETFEGDHNGQVPLNFETKVLPFFSRQLRFEK